LSLSTNGKGKSRATQEEQDIWAQENEMSSIQESTGENSPKSKQEDADLQLARRLQQEEDEEYFGIGGLDPRFFEDEDEEDSEPFPYKKTKRDKFIREFNDVREVATNPSCSTSEKTSLIKKLENRHGDFLNSDPIKNLPLDAKLDKLQDHLMDLLENSSHLSSPASEYSTDTTESYTDNIKSPKNTKDKDDSDEGGKPSSSGTTSEPNLDKPSSNSSSNHRLGLEDIKFYLFMCFSYLAEILSNILDNFFF
jgi:hypothetical protein